MKNLVKSFDKMPWIVKLLLCLPVLNITWAIYRIAKGSSTNNTAMLIAGIVWIFVGSTVLWIVDLVCTIVYKQPNILA